MGPLEIHLLTISVSLHAGAAGLAGTQCVQLRLPASATAGDAKGALAALHPALAQLLPSCVIATDSEYLRDAAPLGGVGRLHLIPPVSGG